MFRLFAHLFVQIIWGILLLHSIYLMINGLSLTTNDVKHYKFLNFIKYHSHIWMSDYLKDKHNDSTFKYYSSLRRLFYNYRIIHFNALCVWHAYFHYNDNASTSCHHMSYAKITKFQDFMLSCVFGRSFFYFLCKIISFTSRSGEWCLLWR